MSIVDKFVNFFMEVLAIPIIVALVLWAIVAFVVSGYNTGMKESDALWSKALCYPEAMISFESKDNAVVEVVCSTMKITAGATSGLTYDKK